MMLEFLLFTYISHSSFQRIFKNDHFLRLILLILLVFSINSSCECKKNLFIALPFLDYPMTYL